MKRDMELVRKLLLFLEEKPDHTIGQHLVLLYEAGYIEGEPQVSKSSKRVISSLAQPSHLGWI